MLLKRISAFIAAGPLVAAGFLAVTAGSASATSGTTIATTNAGGYEASGRDFRFITSTITIPDDSFASLYGGFYPEEYIQLSNGSLNNSSSVSTPTGDQYVRAGVETCQVAALLGHTCTLPGEEWTAFVETYDSTLFTPLKFHFIDLAGVKQGDGVNFSIYFDQAGNELHFTITPPSTSGPEQFYKMQAFGPIFDHAAAIDDFVNSAGHAPIGLPPFVQKFQVNSFLQGALTTYSGKRGSFLGPWTTSEVQATSNGLPYPSGTVRVNPDALYGDGLSANGAVRPQDAFDIWAR